MLHTQLTAIPASQHTDPIIVMIVCGASKRAGLRLELDERPFARPMPAAQNDEAEVGSGERQLLTIREVEIP